jgi:hypothetical protein
MGDKINNEEDIETKFTKFVRVAEEDIKKV